MERALLNGHAIFDSFLFWIDRYETPEANTITHRASEPYKTFRAAVAEQKLLERPSDLRFWRPTEIGFLSRPGTASLMKANAGSDTRYAVANELTPRPGNKGHALGELQRVAGLAADTPSTVSFWVLDRGEGDEDESLYVFSLFESKADAEGFEGGEAGKIWKRLDDICESRRRTTWLECGIGFIGRS